MADVRLGTLIDADGDEIDVLRDPDGTVTFRWEHGCDMVLGRHARDELHDMLGRAAMPGVSG